jgi:hypothetical protein
MIPKDTGFCIRHFNPVRPVGLLGRLRESGVDAEVLCRSFGYRFTPAKIGKKSDRR